MTYGPIAADMCILHSCDTPRCVRPEHLFLGTKGDNARDRAQKGRSASGLRSGHYTHPEKTAKGERHWKAKLTDAQVLEIRARYQPYTVTREQLAREYGVSRSLISQIVDNHIWRHL